MSQKLSTPQPQPEEPFLGFSAITACSSLLDVQLHQSLLRQSTWVKCFVSLSLVCLFIFQFISFYPPLNYFFLPTDFGFLFFLFFEGLKVP